MNRVISIVDARSPAGDVQPAIGPVRVEEGTVLDRLRRPLHDLRISVTDRCNFRCTYCMPKEVFDRDYHYLPHADLLSFEEIVRVARAFVALGVEKIRLTGGEPLLRKDLERLVAMLAGIELPGRPGRKLDLTLTTNGSLLRKKAADLRAAGLERITVSLDALDDPLFRALNDVDYPVAQVLDGISAAMEAGFAPVKVNMVVKRGVNDSQIEAMARHFRGTGVILRFIEYMDVGVSNGWKLDEVVSSAEVVRRVGEFAAIEPLEPNYPGEVAQRWRYLDGSGEIGLISSVTQAFCSSCTRARLAPDGRIYTCLFAGAGTDLRALLRADADDVRLAARVAETWRNRTDRYSEIRSAATIAQRDRVEMSFIGG